MIEFILRILLSTAGFRYTSSVCICKLVIHRLKIATIHPSLHPPSKSILGLLMTYVFYNVLGREYLVGGVVVSFLRKFMLYNCQSWNLFDQRFVNLVEEPGSGNDGGFEQEVL